jgi:hypothetical protein
LKWDGKQDFLNELEAEGEPVEALDTKVDPFDDMIHIWSLFWKLSSKRSNGFSGPNPISIVEIESALRVYEINGWIPKMDFIHYVEIMDSAFMDYHYPKK